MNIIDWSFLTRRQLEFKLKFKVGAISLEVRQIKRPRVVDRMTGDLCGKSRSKQDLWSKIDLQCRAYEQCVTVEGLKRQPVVGAVIFGADTQRDCWGDAICKTKPYPRAELRSQMSDSAGFATSGS